MYCIDIRLISFSFNFKNILTDLLYNQEKNNFRKIKYNIYLFIINYVE